MVGKQEMNKDANTSYYLYLSVVFLLLIIVLGAVLYMMPNDDEVVVQENPVVVFETNYGNFKAEIFLNESPITAGNFIKLVNEDFYNGIKFHRVIQNFMIQGGDPLTKDDTQIYRWGTGGPGYSIEDEFVDGLSNVRGTLSMANAGPNSGGSQFFINVVDNTQLDWNKEPSSSKHPVFGKIIDGMGVVDTISKVTTSRDPPINAPVEPVIMINVYVEE